MPILLFVGKLMMMIRMTVIMMLYKDGRAASRPAEGAKTIKDGVEKLKRDMEKSGRRTQL